MVIRPSGRLRHTRGKAGADGPPLERGVVLTELGRW